MIYSAKFWIPMTVFQVVFGFTVFAITRQIYRSESSVASVNPVVMRQSFPAWSGSISNGNMEQVELAAPDNPISQDPVEISRRANAAFSNKQYARAADFYEQLLAIDPGDVNTYNNLGITLHYLGRSDEALVRLHEGVAADSNYQRIWLTLGFVNSQIGNMEQSRAALATAIEMGVDNDVGQSAAEMLESL